MDPALTTVLVGLLIALVGAAHRLIRAGTRWIEVRIFASAERSRRRNLKRARRESSGLLLPSGKPAVPEHIDEESTDTYELVELELEQQRERERVTRDRRRGGTRPPRRGTHHDGED